MIWYYIILLCAHLFQGFLLVSSWAWFRDKWFPTRKRSKHTNKISVQRIPQLADSSWLIYGVNTQLIQQFQNKLPDIFEAYHDGEALHWVSTMFGHNFRFSPDITSFSEQSLTGRCWLKRRSRPQWGRLQSYTATFRTWQQCTSWSPTPSSHMTWSKRGPQHRTRTQPPGPLRPVPRAHSRYHLSRGWNTELPFGYD